MAKNMNLANKLKVNTIMIDPEYRLSEMPVKVWVYLLIVTTFYISFFLDLLSFNFVAYSDTKIEEMYYNNIDVISSSIFWQQGIYFDIGATPCHYFYPNLISFLFWKFTSLLLAMAFNIYSAFRLIKSSEKKDVDVTNLHINSDLNDHFRKLRLLSLVLIFAFGNLIRYFWWQKAGYVLFQEGGNFTILSKLSIILFYLISFPYILFPMLWFWILSNKNIYAPESKWKKRATTIIALLLLVDAFASLLTYGFRTCIET